MKDTRTIRGKEHKFVPIHVSITNQNFYTTIPMNRSTTFWRSAASLIVVLTSLFTTSIFAENSVKMDVSSPDLANISLYAAKKVARVGDLVTIEVATGGFVDVEDVLIPMRWDPSILSFQNVSGLSTNLTGFSLSNFNLMNINNGTIVLNWSGTATSITDGMPFFTLSFRVIAYNATPTPVSFTNIAGGDQLTMHTLGGVTANVTPNNGEVRLIAASCPTRPAGLSCQTAPILNGSEFPYYYRLPDANSQTMPSKGTICTAPIENNHWLAFIASSTSLTFKLQTYNCGLGEGIQCFIYSSTDCDTFQREACMNKLNVFDGQVDIPLLNLVVGKTYYIMIDGWFGAVCNYTISVVSGQIYSAVQTIPSPTITGTSAVCGSRTGLTFSVPTTANVDSYKWRLPSSATPTTPILGANQTSITVDWGSVSDSVCVKLFSRCDSTKWFCKAVKVGTPTATTLNITKCTQAPYVFKGGNIYAAGTYKDTLTGFSGCDSVVTLNLSNIPAILKDTTVFKCAQDPYRFGGSDRRSEGDYSVTLATAAGCDSTVNLHLFNYPLASKSIDTTICAGTSIIVGGRTFNAPYNSTVVVTRASSRGCDSTISLRLSVIDFLLPTPSKSNDITCAAPLSTLTAIIQNQPPSGVLTYDWRNPSNVSIGTTPSVNVNQAGIYTLNLTVTLNGKSCTKSTTVTVAKTGNQPTKPTIAGPNLACIGRTEIYTLPALVAGATNYNWTVSNGTFTTQTNQITATWNANATSSKVCINAENACGVSDTACISVDIGKIPTPLSITGSTTVCPDAIITYRVTQPANTTLTWSVTGGTARNAFNTDSLWVQWATTTGIVTVTPTSRCGVGTATTLTVQVSTTLPDSLPIQGNATPCSNDTTVTYSVASSATTIEYVWQVPTGATILSGQGTRTIRVTFGSFSGNGQVFLTTKNACKLSRGVSFPVNVKAAAFPPPTIIGSRTVCPSTQISFSTPRDPNLRSYTWTVPTDAVILRGAGTDSIRVDWNISASGQVCLDVENTCGVRQRTCINVDVRADLDSLVISGGSLVCKDSTLRFCVPDDGSALRFLWQIPTGSAFVSGQGTSCVNVRFASTGGTVRVTPVGGCADSKLSRQDVVVKLPVAIVGSVVGKNTVCQSSVETYSVAALADVSRYVWSLPQGMSFVGDSTGNVITVNITNVATSGFLTVRALNNCGLGNGVTLRVSVVPRPVVNAGADTSVCGKTLLLNGSTSGTTKTWSVVSKPSGATANFAFLDRSQTTVTVSKSGVYAFRFEETNGTDCSVADSINVTFRDVPIVTLIDQNCSQEAVDYRVQLSISGGGTQYAIGGSVLGSLQGNGFISNPIGSGAPYFFIVTDNFGCKSDTFKGSKICPCYTSAGTLKADSLVVCYGTSGKITPLGDAKLDANDVSEYVLHNGSATRIGAIFMRNKTGIFTFNPAIIVYNRVYYVSFVVGDQAANGNVDTSKRCVSWSRSVPIIFKDKVTASLTGDTTVCRFSLVSLLFKTSQTGLFDIVYRGDSAFQATALNLQNGAYVNVNPAVSATYRMLTATDKDGCKAQIVDSARVNIRPLPTAYAGEDKSICNNQFQMEAAENFAYVGKWTSLTSGIQIVEPSNAHSVVRGLQNGKNTFIWTVKDSACQDYSVRATVNIFLPLLPKAVNLSLVTYVGVPIMGNVTENAPSGTYSVTRLTNPDRGRFDLFSSGAFNYIPDSTFTGITKFRYIICSDKCTQLCDTGEVRILIKPKEDTVKVVRLDIPNAITPNDDGKNDALVIDGLDKFSENELVIFNRWGDVLYKSKPYHNEWRGTNQSGNPLPEGTYYYVLRLNTADGKILRGDMTILR